MMHMLRSRAQHEQRPWGKCFVCSETTARGPGSLQQNEHIGAEVGVVTGKIV